VIHGGVIVGNDEDCLRLRIRTYITDRYKLTVYPGEDYGELFDLEEDPENCITGGTIRSTRR
jgi:arylsulfatase